jgi:hypothetical protein
MHAVGDAHKVSVVSFGLFGDQDVFRTEATGAAQVVAGRFGRGSLALTGVRHKVVVISACYSGVFIPRLANPNVLVITAADADHSSFGCQTRPSGPILAMPF